MHVTGDIRVDADLRGFSNADATGVAISALASFGKGGGTTANAQLRPVVLSSIGGGTVTSDFGGIGVSALYNANTTGGNTGPTHSAQSDVLGVAGSAFVGIGGAIATAHDAGIVDASVGSGAILSGSGALATGPNAGKGIAVLAASYSAPDSTANGVSAAGLFAAGSSESKATFDGTTLAHLDGRVNSGASLAVSAYGTARTTASAFALAGGLLSAGGGVTTWAKVTPHGTDATVRASTGTNSLTVDGNIDVTAVLVAIADADGIGIEISALSVSGHGGANDVQAILDTESQANIGGGTITSTSGGISVTSRYNANATGGDISGVAHTANANSVAVSASVFFGDGGSVANAQDHGIANASVGSGATLSAGGPIALLATSYSTPKAVTSGVAASLGVSLGSAHSDAVYDGSTRAHLDGGVTAGGSLSVKAFSTARPESGCDRAQRRPPLRRQLEPGARAGADARGDDLAGGLARLRQRDRHRRRRARNEVRGDRVVDR